MVTLVARRGVLLRRINARSGIENWMVAVEEHEAEAVAYPALAGALFPGDHVLLNTTAVELGLGTGGQHFIMARLEAGAPAPAINCAEGHIIKLRYTPLQCRVCAAEEEAGAAHELLRTATTLPGTPVICLGLHSQLAPAAAGIKAANPRLRVGYLMTDSAALPAAYSRLTAELRAAGLLDVLITAGQAFGGDLEAVNVYSGMLVGALAGEADVLIAGQGPGNVGTATALGFGGAEQAALLNAAVALNGKPIAVPRLSFADPRPRHRGISHHSNTVLGQLTLAPVLLPLPELPPAQMEIIREQLQQPGLAKHEFHLRDGEPGIALCSERGIPLRSMGRDFTADPAFFLAAGAAGRLAAELVESGGMAA